MEYRFDSNFVSYVKSLCDEGARNEHLYEKFPARCPECGKKTNFLNGGRVPEHLKKSKNEITFVCRQCMVKLLNEVK